MTHRAFRFWFRELTLDDNFLEDMPIMIPNSIYIICVCVKLKNSDARVVRKGEGRKQPVSVASFQIKLGIKKKDFVEIDKKIPKWPTKFKIIGFNFSFLYRVVEKASKFWKN